jgi:hypothetical protein
MSTGTTLPAPTRTEPEQGPSQSGWLQWAWVSLFLLPVSFFVGFAAAHVPYALAGRDEGDPAPWWFDLLVAVVGVGITWLPVGASLVFGRRALREGYRLAWIPLGIAVLLTAGALTLVVASTISG